jgi:hypothetical protein
VGARGSAEPDADGVLARFAGMIGTFARDG